MVKVSDRVTKFRGYFPFWQGSPGIEAQILCSPRILMRIAAELRPECLDGHQALVGYGFPYLSMTVGRLIYQSHVFRDALRGGAVGLLEEARWTHDFQI